MKAHDIVFELIQSLDQDKGKKIAASLLILYDFVIREIMDGDTNLNTKAIDNAKRILSELRKSWKDIKTSQDKEIKDTDNIETGTDLSG
jgi:flagellar biosynthetic protein FliS